MLMRASWMAVLVAVFGLSVPSVAADGGAESLPSFKLKDPAGKEFTDADVRKAGVVIVVTIPNVKHQDPQKHWVHEISKEKWGADGPKFILIEDLAQSPYKDKSMNGMKESYKAGSIPQLLVDDTGDFRRALGVQQDETNVLVYDKDGRLLAFEKTSEDLEELVPKEALQRVHAAIAKLFTAK